MTDTSANTKQVAQTFRKGERLCSKLLTDQLFANHRSLFVHPFKLLWMETELQGDYPAQVLVTASKKHYKKAVDRNYIKRLLREAYRKNKASLYDILHQQKKQVALAILCVNREKLSYADTEEKIVLLLQKLKAALNETS